METHCSSQCPENSLCAQVALNSHSVTSLDCKQSLPPYPTNTGASNGSTIPQPIPPLFSTDPHQYIRHTSCASPAPLPSFHNTAISPWVRPALFHCEPISGSHQFPGPTQPPPQASRERSAIHPTPAPFFNRDSRLGSRKYYIEILAHLRH